AFFNEAVGPRAFDFLGNNSAIKLSVIANTLLLVMLTFAHDGVTVFIRRANGFWLDPLRKLLRRRPPPEISVVERAPTTPKSLTTQGVTVAFGGTVALRDFSIEVNPGEVVGLIGPNGAGKTTAIEAITGFVRPRDGSVTLGDANVDRWTPERRARNGLSRSFQSLELFDDLTVLENIQAACDDRDFHAYLTDPIYPGRGRLTQLAHEVIAEFGFDELLHTRVRDLSFAQRRELAVARAVAGGQSVLLLDEPASGLDRAQTKLLGRAIRRLAAERNVAVLLVEHNVEMVLETCDRIYALNFGVTIGHGTPAEIRRNPAVVEAYLGTGHSDPDDVDDSLVSAEP
ncbi:MAG: putative branched chain amino acid transporter ATP-binding protein, partial [Acidimicrobiia bacterium]|nr:putative branched chain amino acid transporter ATP-binding protein [Acidimicrobiia bacterium]